MNRRAFIVGSGLAAALLPLTLEAKPRAVRRVIRSFKPVDSLVPIWTQDRALRRHLHHIARSDGFLTMPDDGLMLAGLKASPPHLRTMYRRYRQIDYLWQAAGGGQPTQKQLGRTLQYLSVVGHVKTVAGARVTVATAAADYLMDFMAATPEAQATADAVAAQGYDESATEAITLGIEAGLALTVTGTEMAQMGLGIIAEGLGLGTITIDVAATLFGGSVVSLTGIGMIAIGLGVLSFVTVAIIRSINTPELPPPDPQDPTTPPDPPTPPPDTVTDPGNQGPPPTLTQDVTVTVAPNQDEPEATAPPDEGPGPAPGDESDGGPGGDGPGGDGGGGGDGGC
jgi:hypothetical protein